MGDGPLHLVLGGARSGKSRRAEALALGHNGLQPVYVATAEALDDEMAGRIAQHRVDRAKGNRPWHTVEETLDLAGVLREQARPGHVVLVDCLTLWLTNVMLADQHLDRAMGTLVEALVGASGPIVCVSNEVGLGLVPDNALGRRFRDAQGRLNQRVAAVATHVEFMAAGLSLTLKRPESAMEADP
ncbi:MAG: bifunctional adenosylcobinamide kinase/adenosylcobinamide-phosphate guanylyltransferase [Alphaproteobacteria bacterium]